MFRLNFKKFFLKKEQKLIKKNPEIRKDIDKTIDFLTENPKNKVLKSHKVILKNKDIAFSSRVTGDIRIIWDYHNEETRILDILDIGGHSGKNKIYKS